MAKLLLGNDKRNRDAIWRRLGRKGYAMGSTQALKLVLAETPKLTLINESLPVRDAWEATQRIRATILRIPITPVTARVMEEERSKARQVGCDNPDTGPRELSRPVGKLVTLLSAKS